MGKEGEAQALALPCSLRRGPLGRDRARVLACWRLCPQFIAAPFGHQFSLDFNFGNADDSWSSSIDLSVGELIESFETADFSFLPWEFSGASDWSIDFLNASSGTYSARSGFLSDAEQGQNITSDLLLSITTVEDGSISFSKKIS